jgi:hypothetical protein
MTGSDLVDCQAGYYCPVGSTSSTQSDCPAGHYCPLNSRVPVPCPRGTFSAATKLSALSQCATCSVGSYCEKAALTAVTGSCEAGYFCKDAHYVARPAAEFCPKGYRCPVGSIDKTKCTTGYQDQIMQSTCKSCPAGFSCPTEGDTTIIKKVMCDANADPNNSFYCAADDLDKTTCGAGYYSVSKLSSSEASD